MRLSVSADTNIVFSGLYYGGKAYPLIQAVKADKLDFYHSEYLQKELIAVSQRGGYPLGVLDSFYSLDNVRLVVEEQAYSGEDFEAAGKLVRDLKDVPVYLFAKRMLTAGKIEFFATGDSDLLTDEVKATLPGKIITLKELNERLAEL